MPSSGGRLLIALVAASSIAATARAQEPTTGIITTFAGTGTHGYTGDGAPANEARLSNPYGVAFDAAGNVYIADQANHRIRKVTAATGVITTIAGDGSAGPSGDGGPATAAKMNSPSAVAVDAAGNIYVADLFNYRIRRVSAATGVITTVAGSGTQGSAGDGGPATAAQLNMAIAIALDASGNLYIADTNNHRVRVVSAATGVITTMAGSGTLGFAGDGGPAAAAKLNAPAGVAVDGSGNVYIADGANHRIRKVTAATGIITTAAGTATGGYAGENVPATTAQLYFPRGLATDTAGNLYIVDAGDSRVRKIIVATGKIITVVGNGIAGDGGDTGQAPAARLYDPTAVAVDPSGRIYVADKGNARIRRVAAPTPTLQMTTLAGTGVAGYDGDSGLATSAKLNNPTGIAVDVAGNVFITDQANHRVRRVAAATGVITTIAGTGVPGFQGEGVPAATAQLSNPSGLAVDGAGNLYIADMANNRVRKITAATGIITTVAGSGATGAGGDGGAATGAQLYQPYAVAVDAAGNIYIADRYNHKIRKVTAATGIISTIAGTGTAGYLGDGNQATTAQLNNPIGVAVDAAGNVYLADSENYRVRKITAATGIITTVAGNGSPGTDGDAVPGADAILYRPSGLAVDAAGNLYISDMHNNRIRRLTAGSGIVYTVAGSVVSGSDGDGGAATAGHLWLPLGVAVGPTGMLYIADQWNHRVRRAALPLGNPIGLTAAAITPTAVRLSWPAAQGAVAYTIKRGTTSGGESVIASAVSVPGFIDTPLATNTTYYYVISALAYGLESAQSNEALVRVNSTTVFSDFDGDRRADLTVYRPSDGRWYIVNSSTNNTTSIAYQWGVSTDIPVAGDYDGDRKVDLAVYRPSDGRWYVAFSTTNFTTYAAYQWGLSTDTPVPGDYDGDGKTDIAIYRSSTGTWYILLSGSGNAVSAHQWGQSGDIPVAADFDGDRKTDVAIFRPSAGVWYVLLSSSNWASYSAYGWGASGDTPVAGDYDGDGKADPAIYRSSTGQWFILRSSTSFSSYSYYNWGVSSDAPVPADYDGDGRLDVAVYRPSTGTWFVLFSSTNGTTFANYQWGVATDIPIPRR